MEGRFDWGRYDFGTFRRRDVLKMGRFDCKAATPCVEVWYIDIQSTAAEIRREKKEERRR